MSIKKIIKKTGSILVACSVFGLVACSQVIDSSSPENFKLSTEKMMQGMSAKEMSEFRSSLKKASSYIASEMAKENQGGHIVAAIINPNAYSTLVVEQMHGKSAGDIKKMAEKWDVLVRERKEIEEKERKARRIAGLKEVIDMDYKSLITSAVMGRAVKEIKVQNVALIAQPGSYQNISLTPLLVTGRVENKSNIAITGLKFFVSGIFIGRELDRALGNP